MPPVKKQVVNYKFDNDERHFMDLYDTENSTRKAIVLIIHGGAWRTGDKSVFAGIGSKIASKLGSKYIVVIPNYTLSLQPNPQQHPIHVNDCLSSLEFLLDSSQYASYGINDNTLVYLIGHSAGAFTCFWMLMLQSMLLHRVKGILGVSGIYDLVKLVTDYPSYKDFIIQAFGSNPQQWLQASIPHNISSLLHPNTPLSISIKSQTRFLLAHSPDDELLCDNKTTGPMVECLKKLGVNVKHDTTSLCGGHDESVAHEKFAKLICRFVSDDEWDAD